jgi:hypothetical protein
MCPPDRAHTRVRPYMCLLIFERNSILGFPVLIWANSSAPRDTPSPFLSSYNLQPGCLTTSTGQGESPITRSVTLPMRSFFNPVRP